jgi:hypothetical protein
MRRLDGKAKGRRHVSYIRFGRYSFAVPEEVQRSELRPLWDLASIDDLEDV